MATAYAAAQTRLRLYNVTTSAVVNPYGSLPYSMSGYTGSSGSHNVPIEYSAVILIPTSTGETNTLRVEQICTQTNAGGQGYASNTAGAREIYMTVEITLLTTYT